MEERIVRNIRFPKELESDIKAYQERYNVRSFNQAVITLLTQTLEEMKRDACFLQR